MKYIALLALAALTGCTTIKTLNVNPQTGQLSLAGYQSSRDLELTASHTGSNYTWTVKANASTPMKVMLDGAASITEAAVKGAVKGTTP